MKKRIRKKRRVGEYSEYGKKLVVYLKPDVDSDSFFDDLIEQIVEINCSCGGAFYENYINIIVQLGLKGIDHEAKFAVVSEWLDNNKHIERWNCGDLIDLNDHRKVEFPLS